MSSLLTKLTIVIPTFERHSFVTRAMKFWDGKGPRVYVLDGSKSPIPKGLLETFSEKINYIHLPVSFADRLAFFCDQMLAEGEGVDEYLVLQGDDEFYIPNGLEKCIERLESDKDLTTCSGVPMGFRPVKGFGIEGFKCYEKLFGYMRCESEGEKRAAAHMGNFVQAHIYSVVRKSCWIHSTKAFCDGEIPVYAMYEIQFEMSASFAGKSMVLPHLTWMRSYDENPNISNTEADTSFDIDGYHFDDWWESENFTEQRAQFIDQTSSAFSEMGQIPIEQAKRSVVLASKAYVTFLKEKKASFRVFIGKYTPRILKLIVQKLRIINKRLKSRADLVETAENFTMASVNVDLIGLIEIQDILLDFHKIERKD